MMHSWLRYAQRGAPRLLSVQVVTWRYTFVRIHNNKSTSSFGSLQHECRRLSIGINAKLDLISEVLIFPVAIAQRLWHMVEGAYGLPRLVYLPCPVNVNQEQIWWGYRGFYPPREQRRKSIVCRLSIKVNTMHQIWSKNTTHSELWGHLTISDTSSNLKASLLEYFFSLSLVLPTSI